MSEALVWIECAKAREIVEKWRERNPGRSPTKYMPANQLQRCLGTANGERTDYQRIKRNNLKKFCECFECDEKEVIVDPRTSGVRNSKRDWKIIQLLIDKNHYPHPSTGSGPQSSVSELNELPPTGGSHATPDPSAAEPKDPQDPDARPAPAVEKMPLPWRKDLFRREHGLVIMMIAAAAAALIAAALVVVGWGYSPQKPVDAVISKTYTMELGEFPETEYLQIWKPRIAAMECVLWHYGRDVIGKENDSFVNIYPMTMAFEDGRAFLHFEMLHHKVIGTSFKCHIDFRPQYHDSVEKFIDRLRDIGKQSLKSVTLGAGVPNRVWLLFGPPFGCSTATSVDGKCKQDLPEKLDDQRTPPWKENNML